MLTIDGRSFLLPASAHEHALDEIRGRIDEIRDALAEADKMAADPLSFSRGDAPLVLKLIKEDTGIMGFPFDLRDVELYILEHRIDIKLEVRL